MINELTQKQTNFILNFIGNLYDERKNKNKIVAITQKLDDKNYMTTVFRVGELIKLKFKDLVEIFYNIVSYSITDMK